MSAIRSRAYLDGARGENCKLRVAGVCRDDRSTVVSCHGRDRHAGGASKASDLSVIDGCFDCHAVFDRRAKMPDGDMMSEPDWRFYALRGLQETLERRVEQGLLIVKQDAKKTFAQRAVKPRKPKAERQPLQQENDMNEDANSQTFEQATTPNESPTPAPLTEAAILEPLRGVVITLSNRLDDAMSKQRQFQNEAHDLRLQLQRTDEAAEYHGKRAAAIQRRIVTSRDAIRAWEDEQAIVV